MPIVMESTEIYETYALCNMQILSSAWLLHQMAAATFGPPR